MIDKYVQETFSQIEPFLPEDWSMVVFYAEYDVASFSMEFYVRRPKGKFVSCFDFGGVSEKALAQLFASLDKIMSAQRADLSEKELWSFLTMTVDDKGKIRVDYGYEDLADTPYRHKQAWERKYLS